MKEGSLGLLSSHYGGQPWLSDSNKHPICPNCQIHMPLFLQLNLSELPEAVKGEYGDGLIQVFYCTNLETDCEVNCEAFFPFSKSVCVRLVKPIAGIPTTLVPEPDNVLPASSIESWDEYFEYPSLGEADELGLGVDEALVDELESNPPLDGDKLGGYPAWIQSVEYPDCPQCLTRMRLIYQIQSNENLPWSFGDEGCAYVTQCENHPETLALVWQCG